MGIINAEDAAADALVDCHPYSSSPQFRCDFFVVLSSSSFSSLSSPLLD